MGTACPPLEVQTREDGRKHLVIPFRRSYWDAIDADRYRRRSQIRSNQAVLTTNPVLEILHLLKGSARLNLLAEGGRTSPCKIIVECDKRYSHSCS